MENHQNTNSIEEVWHFLRQNLSSAYKVKSTFQNLRKEFVKCQEREIKLNRLISKISNLAELSKNSLEIIINNNETKAKQVARSSLHTIFEQFFENVKLANETVITLLNKQGLQFRYLEELDKQIANYYPDRYSEIQVYFIEFQKIIKNSIENLLKRKKKIEYINTLITKAAHKAEEFLIP